MIAKVQGRGSHTAFETSLTVIQNKFKRDLQNLITLEMMNALKSLEGWFEWKFKA